MDRGACLLPGRRGERVLAIVDGTDRKVHLLGHSYGGGLALHIALRRPARILSLSLYEPSAFHLLGQFGEIGAAAFAEIKAVASNTGSCIVTGDYRGAATQFVNYWGGPQAWDAIKQPVQQALIGWAPKAPLDFRALIEEPTSLSAYARLRFPVLVVRGNTLPRPPESLPICCLRCCRRRHAKSSPVRGIWGL